jgi:hypothetical protein
MVDSKQEEGYWDFYFLILTVLPALLGRDFYFLVPALLLGSGFDFSKLDLIYIPDRIPSPKTAE